MLFSRNQAQIGVAVTDQEIRAVRVLWSRTGLRLMDTAILPVQTTITAALHQLSQRLAYSARDKSIFAVNFDHVICKTIDLGSELNEIELATYFKNQTPKWFGLRSDEIDFDYQPLIHTSMLNRWQIVASKKTHVQEKITQSNAAGFKLRAIDVDLLALTRVHPYIHVNLEDHIAIAIIEPLRLQFCILHQQQLIYHAAAPLPADDAPFYLDNLLAHLVHQTHAHPSLSCIYLAGHTLALTDFIADINAKTKIMTQVINLLPQGIHLQVPFDSRLLMSLSLALWGLVA